MPFFLGLSPSLSLSLLRAARALSRSPLPEPYEKF